MKTKTKIQIHQAIEYIKQDPEFSFDTHDNPGKILNHFGINIKLKPEEKEIYIKEIKKITNQAQTTEIIRLINQSPKTTAIPIIMR